MDVPCVGLKLVVVLRRVRISIVLKGLLKWQNMLTTIMENRGKTNEYLLPRPRPQGCSTDDVDLRDLV